MAHTSCSNIGACAGSTALAEEAADAEAEAEAEAEADADAEEEDALALAARAVERCFSCCVKRC